MSAGLVDGPEWRGVPGYIHYWISNEEQPRIFSMRRKKVLIPHRNWGGTDMYCKLFWNGTQRRVPLIRTRDQVFAKEREAAS